MKILTVMRSERIISRRVVISSVTTVNKQRVVRIVRIRDRCVSTTGVTTRVRNRSQLIVVAQVDDRACTIFDSNLLTSTEVSRATRNTNQVTRSCDNFKLRGELMSILPQHIEDMSIFDNTGN